MSDKMYTITLSERQLRIVNKALDIYSRLGAGQLEIVEEFLREKFWNSEFPSDAVREVLFSIKARVFGLGRGASWGILSENVPEDCREAYDIKQVTRKAIHDEKLRSTPKSERRCIRHTVDGNEYMASNPNLPPVKCDPVRD